jgi:hypothetical protein
MFSVGSHSSSGGDDLYNEAQQTTEMAATLLSTAIGRKAQIQNSLWKALKRHAMRQVKTSDSMFKFVKAVGRAEGPGFEQHENAIQLFMLARPYDISDVEDYCQNGFLPWLTRASFKNYYALLSHIWQLA